MKIVVEERASAALADFLREHPDLASCALIRTEAVQAVRFEGEAAMRRARDGLRHVRLVAVDDALLDRAARLEPEIMRSLDAIHLSAALALGDDLGVVVTYDDRMAEGAALLGMNVASPT